MKRKQHFRLYAIVTAIMMSLNTGIVFAEEAVPQVEELLTSGPVCEPAAAEAPASVQEAPASEPAAVEVPAQVQEVPQEAPVEMPVQEVAQEMVQEAAPVEIPAEEAAPAEAPVEEVAPAPVVEETSEPVTVEEHVSEEPELLAAEEETAQPIQEEIIEAEQPEAPVPFTGTAKIKLNNEYETLYFDKETVLKAAVESANKEYTIHWETRIVENPYDDPQWTRISNDQKFELHREFQNIDGTTFAVDQYLTVKLDENDLKREFRLVLTDIETNEERETELYRFPAIFENPENAEVTEVTEAPEEAEVTEMTEVPETAESTEQTEETETAEVTEQTEEEEAAEATDLGEETETTENTELTEETETAEETEQTEEADAVEEEETDEAPEQTMVEEASARRIEVMTAWENDTPALGASITFTAVLYGYEDTTYQIQWQHSTDGENWEDIPDACESTYTVVCTKDNYKDTWRAAVAVAER